MYQLASLGQGDEVATEETAVVTEASNVDQYGIVGAVWNEIYAFCRTKLPEGNCRDLLGYKPIYFPPELRQKWYIYALIGYAVGRFL